MVHLGPSSNDLWLLRPSAKERVRSHTDTCTDHFLISPTIEMMQITKRRHKGTAFACQDVPIRRRLSRHLDAQFPRFFHHAQKKIIQVLKVMFKGRKSIVIPPCLSPLVPVLFDFSKPVLTLDDVCALRVVR